MPRARKLPPIASDRDRIEAARIAANRLTAELQESDLTRAAWDETAPRWHHYADSVGTIHSQKLP